MMVEQRVFAVGPLAIGAADARVLPADQALPADLAGRREDGADLDERNPLVAQALHAPDEQVARVPVKPMEERANIGRLRLRLFLFVLFHLASPGRALCAPRYRDFGAGPRVTLTLGRGWCYALRTSASRRERWPVVSVSA